MQSIHTAVSRASAHVPKFKGAKVAASMQTCGNYIPGKHPCG